MYKKGGEEGEDVAKSQAGCRKDGGGRPTKGVEGSNVGLLAGRGGPRKKIKCETGYSLEKARR